jgi:hypothetical protein
MAVVQQIPAADVAAAQDKHLCQLHSLPDNHYLARMRVPHCSRQPVHQYPQTQANSELANFPGLAHVALESLLDRFVGQQVQLKRRRSHYVS